MRNQRMISTVIGVMLAGALTYAQAQWLNYPDARIPRTKDGKPNLSAPAPRLNGKPDVSGLWQAERRSASEYNRIIAGFTDIQPDTHDITPNVLNVFWGMKPEEEPLRPEAAALVKYRLQHALEYPHTQCLPGGIPLALLVFTFNDPKYYTRPFTLKLPLRLMPDSDMLEYVCNENERDRRHLEK